MAHERTPHATGNRFDAGSNQPLMPIGMFSRAALLSVKALRAYHDQGILIPTSVDEDTGYRSYHPGQLADAAILSRLRGLDLPLAQVKEILVARDHDAEPVTACIPVAEPAAIPEPNRGLSVIELPRHQAAVIVHQGSYETIGQTYAALGSWVAMNNPADASGSPVDRPDADQNAHGPESMIREIYTVSVPNTNDPAAYRTEICWPI